MKLNHKVFGEGKPLLIMHGLFGMLDNWLTLGRRWSESYRVVLVDLRNHGHSPHSDAFNYGLMMADVLELMDDLDLDEANLLGHSMGGKVAMKIAQNHPERVCKLVVADIAPRAYPVHHQTVIEALLAVPLDRISSRKEAGEILGRYIQQESIRQFFLKNLYWKEKGRLAWRFNLDAIVKNIEEVGREIFDARFEGPALFLGGSASPYINEEDRKEIPLIFPAARIDYIENAGHWLHAEQPAVFYQKVTDFLRSPI